MVGNTTYPTAEEKNFSMFASFFLKVEMVARASETRVASSEASAAGATSRARAGRSVESRIRASVARPRCRSRRRSDPTSAAEDGGGGPVHILLGCVPSGDTDPHDVLVLPPAPAQPAGPVRLDPGDDLPGERVGVAAARRLESHEYLVERHVVEDVDPGRAPKPLCEAPGQRAA